MAFVAVAVAVDVSGLSLYSKFKSLQRELCYKKEM